MGSLWPRVWCKIDTHSTVLRGHCAYVHERGGACIIQGGEIDGARAYKSFLHHDFWHKPRRQTVHGADVENASTAPGTKRWRTKIWCNCRNSSRRRHRHRRNRVIIAVVVGAAPAAQPPPLAQVAVAAAFIPNPKP